MRWVILAALALGFALAPLRTDFRAAELPMTPIPQSDARPGGGLAQPASWSCRADCDACRRYCDYSYGDRRAFTLCMRDCWNNICRWC